MFPTHRQVTKRKCEIDPLRRMHHEATFLRPHMLVNLHRLRTFDAETLLLLDAFDQKQAFL